MFKQISSNGLVRLNGFFMFFKTLDGLWLQVLLLQFLLYFISKMPYLRKQVKQDSPFLPPKKGIDIFAFFDEFLHPFQVAIECG